MCNATLYAAHVYAFTACGAQGEKQRQQMLFGGMRPLRMRRTATVVKQCVHVTTLQGFPHPKCERLHVSLRVVLPLSEFIKIVGETAGSDDEDPLLPQRGKRLPDLEARLGPNVNSHR